METQKTMTSQSNLEEKKKKKQSWRILAFRITTKL